MTSADSARPSHVAPERPVTVAHGPPHDPGPAVSGASARLRALASLSGSLTDALSPAEAAAFVEENALAALGATSAVVITVGAFPTPTPAPGGAAPDTLHVVHGIGLPADVLRTLEALSLDAPVPFAEVARTGAPLYLHSEQELRRYEDWGVAMVGAGARAAAIVPVWANGELRGVLGLAWPVPHIFEEDECAFIITLGVMCAQAIMRAHLRAAERDARTVAEEANRSKTQFLTMISHELRTPMTAVLGYAQLMADEIDGPITPIQKQHLLRVRASGRHLLGLIEDLLGYARVEAGHEKVNVERVLLSQIVEQSLDLMRPLAQAKGLTIRVEGDSGPVELDTDARKLRQILLNLLGNAVKFTDAGDVVLLLRVEGLDAEMRIFFEVSDTGPGISVSDQAHVFEAYWQVDTPSAHTLGGTGLGLPVARQLARLLGGDVSIARSEIGHGSTFVVSIPARYPGPSGYGAATANSRVAARPE